MKIECCCGAKYSFDVTPEMARTGVQFACATCGMDLSELINARIRQEEPGPSPVAAAAPVAADPPAPVESASQARPRVRIRRPEPANTLPDGQQAEAAELEGKPGHRAQACVKHPDHLATEHCYVCHKPICPKCMEVFGYVCSPLCKARAQSHGIAIPVYEGQTSVRDARIWRRTARTAMALGILVVTLLGVWTWYVWFGNEPKPVFSVRFAEPAFSGQSVFCGTNQIVFLHGDVLARHDMKEKREIWSRKLLDKQEIEARVSKEIKAIQATIDRANNEGWEREDMPKMPSREALTRRMERAALAALELRVRGQNIWIASPGKLARYDWESGNPVKEIPIKKGYGGLIAVGDELLVMDTESGKPIVTHVNLTTCDARTEEIGGTNLPALALGGKPNNGSGGTAGPGRTSQELAGLPGTPGKDRNKPLDPQKVAEQAQNLSYPAKIALPAVLANTLNQERTLSELNDQPRAKAPAQRVPDENVSVIPTKDGFVQFSVRTVESKMVARNAMKAPPSKSVFEGTLTVGKTGEGANEILNEMQRSRGGDVVYEDQSRYRVTVRRADGQEAWTGEMTGYPKLYPLQTVTVLVADKAMVVLDKNNRKLWEGTLNYNVRGGLASLDEENEPYGQGPCVEHKGALYVFDEGVLTAFDLATGNVRWRFPSVGITGLFFDDKGMIYVNTTTASPDSIRYSRQIDISRNDVSVVLKLEPRTGKTLWTAEPGGLVNYVSGKYIYVVRSYMPAEPDEEDPYRMDAENQKPPFLRIKRLNPKNGRVMWEHFQQRGPVEVEFDKNTIRLVFKKEVQVLRTFELF